MSDPTTSALDRIDRALSRIERALSAREQARAQTAAAFAKLDSRHDRLRRRVQETIAELDRLMATEGQK